LELPTDSRGGQQGVISPPSRPVFGGYARSPKQHDLNVAAIRFPELPLFQLGKWLCAHFHRGSNPTYRTGFIHSSA
jgi:hypothetical protein